MNEDRIIQSLTQYQGTQESLNETVSVLVEELGPDWTKEVFQKLGGIPLDLKEKLNHVFNYYAALTAWQETQTYLEQTGPLNDSVKERMPVLKHWLDFFGDPGTDLYHQLEEKMMADNSSEIQESEPKETQEITARPEETSETQKTEEAPPQEAEKQTQSLSYDPQAPEVFAIQKAKKEIELLDSVQAWLSARCLQLNNMEVFAYPYYGFAVDLMRQTVKDIQAVLDLSDKSALPALYEGAEEALTRKKQAIEADIETAVQNCESTTTALIDENIDMDKVRKTLGDLDKNPEPEYLGPAPDGFELIEDDDAPLDENALKEKYQQLEKEVLAENAQTEKTISEKKTSQTPKNDVKRKLNFSLKPKK